MAQLRQQFLRRTSVTAAATSVTLVDLVGPESDLASPYAEGSDHVVAPRQVRQNESGWVVIDGWDGSALDSANLTVDVEVWSRASSGAQKGLSSALFPSGAAVAADPVLKRVVASGIPGNSDDILAVFGGGHGTSDLRNKPLIHVRADEFVRLRLTNAAGALGPVVLTAKYDLGLSPADNDRV